MPFEVFCVICELSKRVRLDVIEGGGKCNFAESVMTVGLSIPSRYAPAPATAGALLRSRL
jgi:hypothetical protein